MGLAAYTWRWEATDAFPADENGAAGLVMAAGEDEVVDWRHCVLLSTSYQTTVVTCVCVFASQVWPVNICHGASWVFCI